jgi:Tol biopolymer transport system component
MEQDKSSSPLMPATTVTHRFPPMATMWFFTSDRTGTNHIWRIDIDGSNAMQLTNGEGELTPQSSPTGEWVFYQLTKGGMGKVAIGGGKRPDNRSSFRRVGISPDGKWIATTYFQPTDVKTAIYSIEGGEPHRILDLLGYYDFRWTPDGRALAYVDKKYPSEVSSQIIDGGPLKQLTNFRSDRIFTFVWSNDGKQLAVARGTRNS